MDNLKKHIAELTEYMAGKIDIAPLPKVVLRNDVNESADFLGKTAYYEPVNQTIVLYTAGRHPKDIVRSYAHELIHHAQNLRGALSNTEAGEDPMYTQNDKALRAIEAEAYLKGNLYFRDYCDNKKYNQ